MKLVPLYIFVCLLFTMNLSAQIGIDINYGIHNYKKWNEEVNKDDIFSQGIRLGIDYWFKPIRKRMEMIVGVNYGYYKSEFPYQFGPSGIHLYLNDIKLNIKNNFYMFDFEEPCNCPTFNKSGETFKKGFFLQTILGSSLQLYDLSVDHIDGDFTATNIAYHIGAGAGFDFGISSLLTITPYFNYQYSFHNKYDSMKLMYDGIAANTNRSSLTIGTRIGFRKDYKKW